MKQEVYKLEIFLPESHFDAVREALWSVDAGHIGAYDRCMSWGRVHSCWRPLDGPLPGHAGGGVPGGGAENRGLLPGGAAL